MFQRRALTRYTREIPADAFDQTANHRASSVQDPAGAYQAERARGTCFAKSPAVLLLIDFPTSQRTPAHQTHSPTHSRCVRSCYSIPIRRAPLILRKYPQLLQNPLNQEIHSHLSMTHRRLHQPGRGDQPTLMSVR